MSLVAISTVPDTGRGERWPEFDPGEMIAATLIQQPRYVDAVDERWHPNAHFIAACRTAVPALVAEVRRLQELTATFPTTADSSQNAENRHHSRE